MPCKRAALAIIDRVACPSPRNASPSPTTIRWNSATRPRIRAGVRWLEPIRRDEDSGRSALACASTFAVRPAGPTWPGASACADLGAADDRIPTCVAACAWTAVEPATDPARRGARTEIRAMPLVGQTHDLLTWATRFARLPATRRASSDTCWSAIRIGSSVRDSTGQQRRCRWIDGVGSAKQPRLVERRTGLRWRRCTKNYRTGPHRSQRSPCTYRFQMQTSSR